MDRPRRIALTAAALLAVAVLFGAPSAALAARAAPVHGGPAYVLAEPGALVQLHGKAGCLADSSSKSKGCAGARALAGPGPFMGSRAIAVSPDGRNVYVASSKSNAIAIFVRDKRTGALRQAKGSRGCIAAKGAGGCAPAIGLDGPNSVAVSADGKTVYATSRTSGSITTFRRNQETGQLRQLPPSSAGCIAITPIPGCVPGRALLGADVVVISPDAANVYVGAFFGNAVAAFVRNTKSGVLEQKPGTEGCIAEGGAEGCATGFALGAVEGLAVGNSGANVYAASALSNALAVLGRAGEHGVLSQAADGSGCVSDAALAGCVTGRELDGANAVATSPAGEVVYATSLFSNSVTAFAPTTTALGQVQMAGTAGCLIYLRAAGCSFGRAMIAPEGLAVSPDGESMYVAAFKTGAIDVLDRTPETGAIEQLPGAPGCIAPKSLPGCETGRATRGTSSIAVSPDGRNVYSTAFGSNAVDVFRRYR
jgi:DNA-binding beta-propeller fold protein YncE